MGFNSGFKGLNYRTEYCLYSKFRIQNAELTLKNRRGVLEVRRPFFWWQAKSQYQKQKVLLDYCQLIL